jgi:hypothetical protein
LKGPYIGANHLHLTIQDIACSWAGGTSCHLLWGTVFFQYFNIAKWQNFVDFFRDFFFFFWEKKYNFPKVSLYDKKFLLKNHL